MTDRARTTAKMTCRVVASVRVTHRRGVLVAFRSSASSSPGRYLWLSMVGRYSRRFPSTGGAMPALNFAGRTPSHAAAAVRSTRAVVGRGDDRSSEVSCGPMADHLQVAPTRGRSKPAFVQPVDVSGHSRYVHSAASTTSQRVRFWPSPPIRHGPPDPNFSPSPSERTHRRPIAVLAAVRNPS